MDVRIVSADSDLYKLCRELLTEIGGADWTLTLASHYNEARTADLVIFDYQPELELPGDSNWQFPRKLFLASRADLAALHERIHAIELNVLLKPVSRAALSAFLGLALGAQKAQLSTPESLRSERSEMLQCLMQANLKLQEYDQDRTNYLARAVHDFRAPLAAIVGYCSLLLGEPMGSLNENQKEVLRRVQHSTKRLSRMASAMFELSVGAQVKRRPDMQLGDIRACVEQAVHEIGPFADTKRIALSVELEPHPNVLQFEPGKMEQVLINILDNGCKFAPRGGEIELRGYPYFWERRDRRGANAVYLDRRSRESGAPNAYRIDIRDSGRLIAEEHLSLIFEEYTSCRGGTDRTGGGLGLAICRMILKQHDGHIWAENTENGPMFSLILPYYRGQEDPVVGLVGQVANLEVV